MTVPLALAVYTLGAFLTFAAARRSVFAAVTWPLFWVCFLVWKVAKALRGGKR